MTCMHICMTPFSKKISGKINWYNKKIQTFFSHLFIIVNTHIHTYKK